MSEIEDALSRESTGLRSVSLELHSHPELSGSEARAHALLTDFLEERGFTVTRGAANLATAFIAKWSSDCADSEAVEVAFLSEYDALPGIGHACGHNLIAISGLGAALALKAHVAGHGLNARITLFGTPAEETWGGKINFIEAGAFKDIDLAMMVHPGNVNVTYAKYLALSQVLVDFHGKAAHAASNPWEGVNALDAAVVAYNSMSMLRQQMLPSTRIHAVIKKGGEAANVIPDYTQVEFMMRTEKLATLQTLIPKMNAIFQAAADSAGCTHTTARDPIFEDVVINSHLAARFERYAREGGCTFAPREVQESKSYGSTDMGNVTHVVPGIHPVFDIECTEGDIHTNDFREGACTETAHKATLRAAKCLALTAVDFITDQDFRRAVREEFLNN
ncbi:amidohydrolase [Chytriomyces sp. MP71]|nr:amidohydrolase [Chytriomyces sp. MP71]